MNIRRINANVWLFGSVVIAAAVVLLLLRFPVVPREGALMAGMHHNAANVTSRKEAILRKELQA